MAKDEDEHESRGFKVQDRRRFVDADDDTAAPAGAPRSASVADASPRDAARDDVAAGDLARDAAWDASGAPSAISTPHGAGGDEAAFAEMNFSTFVMGLTTQALMHLGEIPDPVQQGVTQDLAAAKQMIDLLGILRDKTKGNLDAAEEQLLGEVLYDLRMRYVEVARSR